MSLWLGTLSGARVELILPAIGDNVYGGYYTGLIDTTGSGGLKYLLIVAPKSLETVGKRWKTSDTAGPTSSSSVWDGLTATTDMYNAGAAYEAATYCYGLSFPSDGGSRWYLPARDELELIYRNLRPTTESNSTSSGTNNSSSPTGAAYTTTVPAQTSVTAFRSGGAQAMKSSGDIVYYSSTQFSTTVAWGQYFATSSSGAQGAQNKNSTLYSIRPVRRVIV